MEEYKPKRCLILLIGLPGAGKTTLAGCLLEKLKLFEKYFGTHVCFDQLLPPVDYSIGVEQESIWKNNRHTILKQVEDCLTGSGVHTSAGVYSDPTDLQCGVEKTTVIILDDNMYYHSMRYEYYQLAKKYETGFAQVFLKCSLETALQRNRDRLNCVPDDVIINMHHKLEPPDTERFPWESHSVTIDTENQFNIENAIALIHMAIDCPVRSRAMQNSNQKEESQLENSANVIHQADQIMRRLISKEMSYLKVDAISNERNPKTKLKQAACDMNSKKQKIMEKLKHSGLEIIPDHVDLTNIKDNDNFINFIEDLFVN